jgi:hypothetical protein
VTPPTNALNGELLLTALDSAVPSPQITIPRGGESITPILKGLPGQVCSVSSSRDLSNWSEPTRYLLDGNDVQLGSFSENEEAEFFRVVQSLP